MSRIFGLRSVPSCVFCSFGRDSTRTVDTSVVAGAGCAAAAISAAAAADVGMVVGVVVVVVLMAPANLAPTSALFSMTDERTAATAAPPASFIDCPIVFRFCRRRCLRYARFIVERKGFAESGRRGGGKCLCCGR